MCCPAQAVKDLAVTLRGALSMKTADAFRAVYCWQTVRCLELWARVLAEHVHTVRVAWLPGRWPAMLSPCWLHCWFSASRWWRLGRVHRSRHQSFVVLSAGCQE
jgi:Noc2p family